MQRRPYEDGELVAYTTRRHGRTVFTVRFRPFCPVEWRVLFQVEVDGQADVPDLEGIVLAAFTAAGDRAGAPGDVVVEAGGLRIRATPDDDMPDATPEKLRAVCLAVARALEAGSP